jgi:hypothetical protein
MSHLLDPTAKATIDAALENKAPLNPAASLAEVARYASYVASVLRAAEPWRLQLTDQMEVVHLLRGLTLVHEVHAFVVNSDDGDPPLMILLSRWRQCHDSEVARLARTLFARLCSLGNSDSRSEICLAFASAWGGAQLPPKKRARDEDEVWDA